MSRDNDEEAPAIEDALAHWARCSNCLETQNQVRGRLIFRFTRMINLETWVSTQRAADTTSDLRENGRWQ
jgi:hypothetical protein